MHTENGDTVVVTATLPGEFVVCNLASLSLGNLAVEDEMCIRDSYWVGANDHRLALFENCFPIPWGVSYNAYCLLDEKTVLFDTVDWSACRQLLENLALSLIHIFAGRRQTSHEST